MPTQKEAEIKILKSVGCPVEEIPHILQEVDNWDFGKKIEFKKLLPCIQDNEPDFQDRELLVLFLQLLRQMRLAYKVINKFIIEENKKKRGRKKNVTQTDIHDALARTHKPERVDYWMFPEFKNKLNHWENLKIPLYSNGYAATEKTKEINEEFKPQGNNSALKKILKNYKSYITADQQQDAPPIPTPREDVPMPNTNHSGHVLPKNLILYGSPGTGKTYKTVQYAVAIVENKTLEEIESEDYSAVAARYRGHRDKGRICFTTFHQSYEYEEFIEGLRPRLADEDGTNDGELSYEIHDGVFKSFCQAAEAMPVTEQAKVRVSELAPNPTVWKISLERTGDNPTRRECLDNGHIRIGWDGYGPDPFGRNVHLDSGYNALNAFYNRMQVGDIVLSCYSSEIVDAVGVVAGEPEWHDEYDVYKRLRKVRWLSKDIRAPITHLNGGKALTLSALYRLSIPVADILKMIGMGETAEQAPSQEPQNFVFIIDEINRGNMAKIFGELITLIEEGKRLGAKEEMRARLPYSGDYFGVPGNVFIIGTMNTADRSIALMDVALRRRFSFREITPEPKLLEKPLVGGIHIDRLLDLLNRRIESLLDREHVLGHSVFLPLREKPEMEVLAGIMENNVLPLLQEYFYDDYEKIRLVLGDNQKTEPGDVKFLEETDDSGLFGRDADAGSPRYSINIKAFANPLAYKYLGLKHATGDGAGSGPQSEA